MFRFGLPGKVCHMLPFSTTARGWQKSWPLVGDVRRLGAMCAIELVRERETREPADLDTKRQLSVCGF
jgi:4-aminobutyrate aminotransferase-like enzyme